MIIQALITLILGILAGVFSVFNIPALPPEADAVVSSFVGYIKMGIGIIQNYTHMSYLLTLFGIVVAFDVGLSIYKLVMWVLRKIPGAGVE